MTTATPATTPLVEGVGADLAVAALDVAGRCAAGAALWCAAPRWPWHARHLAVEFVHPVVVGARALPASCVEGVDPASTVRRSSRPGDVLVGVGPSEDPLLDDLIRRAEAWGVTTVRLGAGGRRPSGRADHTIWIDDVEPGRAAHDGQVVVLYHLLWELTQVALEHPGLLESDTSWVDGHCVTCSDEGRVGEIRSVDGTMADVEVAGRIEVLDVSLVGPVDENQLVLVHAGVALCTLGGDRL